MWLIAVTVMLGTFMEVLDTSVANVALPHIAGSLSASQDESTWVLTSYLVSNAIVMPLSGWLCSVFGRKRFYLFCVALFTLASLLCGLAPNLPSLIIFRILQGAGGGVLVPISQAILVETFPGELQGLAMAVYGLGVMFAPVIGPTLGGWITDNYSWRWIFFINGPVGLIALVMAYVLVTEPPYLRGTARGKIKVDYIGLGLIAVGLGFMQVVLDKGQREDWFESRWILWMSITVVVSLVAMVFWELRQKEPVVDLGLLKERNFFICTLTMFVVGFAVYGSLVLLPLFLQTLMGYTAAKSGMVLSPAGLVLVLLMPLVGYLLSKVQARWLVLAGLGVVGLALIRMARFNLNVDFRMAMRARMLQSVGEALLFVPINTAAFYFIAKEKTASGTGFMNLARNVGGSFGISIVTTILARRQQFHQNILVAHLTPFDNRAYSMLSSARGLLVSKGSDPAQAVSQSYGFVYQVVQQQSAMLAFADTFWLLGIGLLALVPFILLMKKTVPGKVSLGAH